MTLPDEIHTLYLETSVISYMTAKQTRDVHALSRQAITRRWWRKCRKDYEIFISPLTIEESSRGDRLAAAKRLRYLTRFSILSRNEEIEQLASIYVKSRLVPATSPGDAFHLAFASFYGISYLATWNFKHLANIIVRVRLGYINEGEGYPTPIICTPEELLGE